MFDRGHRALLARLQRNRAAPRIEAIGLVPDGFMLSFAASPCGPLPKRRFAWADVRLVLAGPAAGAAGADECLLMDAHGEVMHLTKRLAGFRPFIAAGVRASGSAPSWSRAAAAEHS